MAHMPHMPPPIRGSSPLEGGTVSTVLNRIIYHGSRLATRHLFAPSFFVTLPSYSYPSTTEAITNIDKQQDSGDMFSLKFVGNVFRLISGSSAMLGEFFKVFLRSHIGLQTHW